MSIAAKTSTSAINLDESVTALQVPIIVATGDAVVVFVSVGSEIATVLSVTDTGGNTYTKKAHVFVENTVSNNPPGVGNTPLVDAFNEVEVWTSIAAGGATSVTVTATQGASFAVAIQSYTGATTFPQAASATLYNTSSPSISLSGMTSTSVLCAGFATEVGLNQAASVGTLRLNATAGSEERGEDLELVIADNTVTSTASTVTLLPANQVVVDGVTVPFQSTYGVVAVEVHV